MIKVPDYIKKHIEMNNKLLEQADKHAMAVRKWYVQQFDKLNSKEKQLELPEIQTNWRANGDIDLSTLIENLKKMEK